MRIRPCFTISEEEYRDSRPSPINRHPDKFHVQKGMEGNKFLQSISFNKLKNLVILAD